MNLQNIVFASHLDEGEQVLAVAHCSRFILFKNSLKTFFFGVALPVVFYLFFPQMILITLFWAICGVIGMLYHFIDWYFDAFLITNVGVVSIKMNGFFDMTSTRIEYHMIEGTSYTIKGFWATVLNFGDLIIDKLGAQTSVALKHAANPKKLDRKIMRFQEQYVNERSFMDHRALKDMLSSMIAYHVKNDKIEISKKK